MRKKKSSKLSYLDYVWCVGLPKTTSFRVEEKPGQRLVPGKEIVVSPRD